MTNSASDSADILTDVLDGIATITFNRPQRKNALTQAMFGEFTEILRGWTDDSSVKVVIITGSGDSFCAGADLSGDASDRLGGHHLERMQRIHAGAAALHEFPKPVIAKVNGVAVGAGMNLALGADIVMMSDVARFSEIFVKRGLSIDYGGSWLLPRLVGMHKAKELALLGNMVDAAEAERIGLVNHVVAADELDERVADMARQIADGPPIATRLIKRQLIQAQSLSMVEALEAESQSQSINFGTADTAEALAAFIEKRTPKFEGR